VTSQDEEEPRNINEALICPTKKKWIKIMTKEFEFIKINQV
jgi:hypothetical protein